MTKRQLEEIIRKEVRRNLKEEYSNKLKDAYYTIGDNLPVVLSELKKANDSVNLDLFKKINQLYFKSDLGKKI